RDFHVTGVQTCALPIFFFTTFFLEVVFLASFFTVFFAAGFAFFDSTGNFSNSLTKFSNTSKPPCQNFGSRMLMPASFKIFSGARSEERRVGKECMSRGL